MAVIVVAGWFGYKALTSEPGAAPQTAVVTPGIRTAKVYTGNLDRKIRIAGQTAAIDFANVIAPILRGPDSGRELVLMDLAPSGSHVKKGDVIVKIDGQAMQDHVDDIADTIEEATADIRKRAAEQEVEWENLQQTIRIAKSEADKWRLDLKGAEMRSDVEKQLLRLSLEEAEARYNQQLSDLDNKKKVHAATLRILEFTKERHVRHRDRHVNDLKKFTIHAPMDGLVVMTSVWRGNEMGQIQQGDSVRPGQLFMKVVSIAKMELQATINQAESSEFRVGQLATLGLDAFPGLTFQGKLHSIGALAVGGWRSNSYVRNIPVRVMIQGNDARLIPDLSGTADVTIGSVKNATIAPLSAISIENGKEVAYVRKGEQWERRFIEVGLKSGTHAQILSGLNPGDEVRLN